MFIFNMWHNSLCERRKALQLRYNGRDGVSNHQPHHCLLNRLFKRRSKETPKLRVTGLCAGNSPVTGEFPAQMASNAENASIWWRHHEGRAACGVIILVQLYFSQVCIFVKFFSQWCIFPFEVHIQKVKFWRENRSCGLKPLVLL